ncbi:MAG: thiamine phosphate synthase [Terriglobia bacterium]
MLPRLYAIVDAAQLGSRPLAGVVDSLLAAGVRLIQYRDKSIRSKSLYAGSLAVRERIRQCGGKLIVNDRADVALAAGADGVHLGQDDLPGSLARKILGARLIGLSTHSLEQIRHAALEPVDYVAFGPIFATASKERADPIVGLEGLAEARKATRKPMVAIGGITLENARAVISSGADSVAVIGALMNAPDIGARAREFLAALGSADRRC